MRVQTSRGVVEGVAVDGGARFGAIPYAQAPDGELRFRAPVPAAAWDGVLDGTRLGPPAPQPKRVLPGIDTLALLGEPSVTPSLTLNVWTPDVAASGLPVLVWLHGGAFVAGSPAQPVYDGASWIRDGVVLVGVTYRLGIEGFVPFAGGETNVGLRDQLLALSWVQEEIAAFGGDPGNVTLAGQSAGAMSAGWLTGSARSRGLFGRSIVASGGVNLTLSARQGEHVAGQVAERLGVEPTAEAMRGVAVADVIAMQGAVAPGEITCAVGDEPDPTGGMLWVLPVRDGDIVADDPLSAAAAAPVDLLAGHTTEEGQLYMAGAPGFDDFPAGAHEAITGPAFREPVEALLAGHAAGGGGATFGYRFGWRSGAVGGRLGAAHAVDLPFFFDALDAPGMSGADDALLGVAGGDPALAARMHAAWVGFVRSGDPGFAPYPAVEEYA